MAEYDPKRRRARPVATEADPAPVDALLDGGADELPRRGVAAASYGTTAPSSTINLAGATGTDGRVDAAPGDTGDGPVTQVRAEPVVADADPGSVAQSPASSGTAESSSSDTRKFVLAGVAGLLLFLLILWARRRRSS